MTDAAKKPSLSLTGGKGIGGTIRGMALVSSQSFGIRYDLDPDSGIISNASHDLFGQSIVGRVLVFTEPKGGIAASWSLADLADRGLAPLGIVFRRASPIFAQGALFAGLPLLHGLHQDPCAMIRSGDEVSLRPDEGRIDVFREPLPTGPKIDLPGT